MAKGQFTRGDHDLDRVWSTKATECPDMGDLVDHEVYAFVRVSCFQQ